mgnify:CR=1 FL=1
MAASGREERDEPPTLGDIADYDVIYAVVEDHYRKTTYDETKIRPEFRETLADFRRMEVPKHLIPDNLDEMTVEQLASHSWEVAETMFKEYCRTHLIEPATKPG